MTDESLKPIIAKLAERQDLTSAEADAAFTAIMEGRASEGQIGAILMGLRAKGETPLEITAGARAMRAKMLPVRVEGLAIDCCGTGGDASGSYNVSTAVSFVLAGGGVAVAKHGNRALSSKSGAADVLTALGVKITGEPERIARAIKEAGVGFMMAPLHHGAMKHVAPVRQALGTRTIFNLLGPLANPAGVKRQLVGVFSERWIDPIAAALKELGTERAWIVHGQGLDELTTTGTTKVAEVSPRGIRRFEVTPQDAGLRRATSAELKGGSAEENAAALKALLAGASGPYRDIVLLNAAAGFVIAGKAETLRDGILLAEASIGDKKALHALERLIAVTND